MASSTLDVFLREHKEHFPLLARVHSLHGESTIVKNQALKEGSEVVLHGWARQSKVLAVRISEGGLVGDAVRERINGFCGGIEAFGIPLTYQGTFRVTSRLFSSLSGMVKARFDRWTQVVEAPDEGDLLVGDVIKLLDFETCKEVENNVVKVVKQTSGEVCELGGGFKGVFAEFLTSKDSCKVDKIKELFKELQHCVMEVEVIQGSEDCASAAISIPCTQSPIDLPLNCRLLLTHLSTEQCVLTSPSCLTTPIFQLPVRTNIQLQLVEKLNKELALFGVGALKKVKAVFSTLDRCVEALPTKTLNSLKFPQNSNECLSFW